MDIVKKSSHTKKHCQWNLNNLNNKLTKVKRFWLMKSSPNITGESKNLLVNNYNQNQSNKSGPIAYWCFICNFLEHKIFDYPHCQATQDMFKDKGSPMEPEKKNPHNQHGVGYDYSESSTQNEGLQGKWAMKNKNHYRLD
jgi:hypothetical protein